MKLLKIFLLLFSAYLLCEYMSCCYQNGQAAAVANDQ